MLGGGGWETVVGLEVHARVASPRKLFSGAPAGGEAGPAPGAGGAPPPNSRVAPFDLALPGALPVLNWDCVDAAVLTGLALGGRVAPWLCFDRKHYFYPDLPHGFQVTQKRRPVVGGGELALPRSGRRVGLAGVQLETDTGKLASSERGGGHFLLDLNRAGCALMEVVTAPDLRSGEEAAEAARELQALLRRLGTSRGAMQDGEFRVDVNVSVREVLPGGPPAAAAAAAGDAAPRRGRESARREVKNLNSFRRIRDAVEYEAGRLRAALEAGRPLPPQTLGWDPQAGRTFAMRDKAADLDYRFTPEPDVPPVELSEAYVATMRGRLEEILEAEAEAAGAGAGALPEGVPPGTAAALASRPELLEFFRAAFAAAPGGEPLDPTALATFVSGEVGKAPPGAVRALLRGGGGDSPGAPRFPPAECAALLGHVRSGRISMRMAKEVCAGLLKEDGGNGGVEAAIAGLGGAQLSDEAELRGLCAAAVGRHPREAAQFRAGRDRLLGLFVGQVLKASGGRANPKRVSELLKELLLTGGGEGAEGAGGPPPGAS